MYFDDGMRKYPNLLHKRIYKKATYGTLTTGICASVLLQSITWTSDPLQWLIQIWDLFPSLGDEVVVCFFN